MRKRKKDPHAAREAAKYDNPVPSREYIIEYLHNCKTSLNLQQICDALGVYEPEQLEAMRRRLRAMVRDDQLEQINKRRFIPAKRRVLLEGVIQVDKKNNIWVIPNDHSARISLPFSTDLAVTQGNRVVVSVPDIEDKKRRLGKLVEVLEKPEVVITGRFVEELRNSFVVPFSSELNSDISILNNSSAKDGDIVVVEIDSKQSTRENIVGNIVEVLGDDRTKEIEINAAVRRHQIPSTWPQDVQAQTSKFGKTVPAAAAKMRIDLRELPLVTIDGEDARDFDDAVFCEPKKSGGWKLYVAIADVSYYVKPGTALDKEAFLRGNSVYFPTKVVPMLPEVLSNGLCSIRPDEDRLCMVCEMSISKSGKLTRYEFYEGIMRSHARMTYTKVAKILQGDKHLRAEYRTLLEDFENLQNLYYVLREEREQRGAIDFETVETKIHFGKNGKISKIDPVERNIAHKIIEECMLLANVATARFLDKNKVPGLYRNHEGPPADKLQDLKIFLKELGLSLTKGKDEPKPLDYGNLLKKIKYRPDAKMIQTVLLRSLSQAVYEPDNIGHFGLAYPAYTHFTSPIRRYPDLIVHRQIKSVLSGKWDPKIRSDKTAEKKIAKQEKQLEDIAHHCSTTERRADDATREVIMALKCQYVSQHIGDFFSGVISGVTKFGIFVELTDIYVDGLVHIASLENDYYIFDPIHHKLTGERSGIEYKIGMSVEVQVASVNTNENKIDFVLVTKRRKKKKKK